MTARILVVDDSPTIRKVVSMILAARSYEPFLAGDGKEALDLLEAQPVDLVLLDFVMPRMNGYQFCRELRARRHLHALPVILMSAKSDKIRGQFVQQTGAVDAITKPFDARGLVAAIEGALKRKREGRLRPVPDASSMPLEESGLEPSGRNSDVGPSSLEFVDNPRGGGLIASLEELLAPELELLAPELERRTLRKALERAFAPDVLGRVYSLSRALSVGPESREALAGDISVISIAEVLQMLELQRQTGSLSVHTRKQEITLHIRDGKLDWAGSHGLGDEFLIGRYLVESGVLSRDRLEKIMLLHPGPKRLLGETLVEAGLVAQEQIDKALRRQSSELVYEAVRWKKGRFAFTARQENLIAEKASLGLETAALVMEGFRRVDEWRVIEGSFDFDEVLYPDPVAIERLGNDAMLTRRERRVLEAIDGERTIREIVSEMGGSSFELCKIVYQFLNSRLVRRRAA
ncbi:MAG TPA: DUF4388 domain-containing protein [Polyangiaceae bacterium]|nr:DUF4388 domain-containing protein [Polyangiaceae bacterium]